ncbi:hypothetical protein SAMN05421504_101909 [Amycolatopsis xylanica]|uniref:Uncharacterized protein n=1 Tax=Amycolatopsis xylanica TaxID=589385 RepID=A0A1H2ULE2_9PSEU|nr:hypothetical protein [Amycolatopsis xylanica]SDW56304.1 hypothetical protein SAMN05421504_101909 [Amycolatopsis xylanica]
MVTRVLVTVLVLVFAVLGVMVTPGGALTGWVMAGLAAGVLVWQAPARVQRMIKVRAPVVGAAVFVGGLVIMGMAAVLGAAVTVWLLVLAALAVAVSFRLRGRIH